MCLSAVSCNGPVDDAVPPEPVVTGKFNAVHQLGSAESALREISRRLAHELRTPLRHVVSYADLLQEDLQTVRSVAELAARTRKIQEAAQRLALRLDELASLTRVLGSELQTQAVDMSALLAQAWATRQACGGDADGVTLEQATALPVLAGDAGMLGQVWLILLQDLCELEAKPASAQRLVAAAQAAPGGWTFNLQLVQGPQDSGCPVCAGPNPDAQCSCEARRALVRRILGCHGGHLWVLAEPGAAPGFGFYLPDPPRA
jgi:hypothetical protein